MGAVVAAVVLAILLVGGAAIAQHSYNETGEQGQTLTETFDAGATGTIITFNESNREDPVYYEETVDVVLKNGETVIEGQDYLWLEDNGTLEVLDGELDNTTDNEITYTYRVPSERQTELQEQIAWLYSSAQWLPFVLIVLLVVLAMSMMGGLS